MVVAAVLWLAAAMHFGQATGTTTGDLRGRVEDESGAAVAGASIEAVSPSTGFSRAAVSGGGGEFALRFLPPGSYDVTASRKGFQALRVAGVAIVVGTTASLRLTLPVARVEETISVGASSPSADLVSTGLESTITQAEIRNLPINRRNFLDFALTTPGVTLDRGPQTGAAPTSGISINGQDPRLNNVQLDGLDDNDAAVGAFRSAVTQEAVLEYQVIRAPYAAEFGRAAGGVINVATRSGSNALAGTAFLFYRDQSLSASNALTGTKTAYEQFQYGASLSGPILSDRLFFFAAAERLSVTDTNTFDDLPTTPSTPSRRRAFPSTRRPTSFDRGRTSVFAKLDAAPSPSQAWALRGKLGLRVGREPAAVGRRPWPGARAAARDLEDAAVAITGISLFGAGASNELRLLAADRTHRLDSLDETGGPSVEIVGVATFGTQQFLPQPRDSRTYEVFDAVSFFGARITGKAGVDYVHTDLQGSLPLYFAGRYEFSSLDAFEQDAPTLFMQGFGDPEREVTTDLFAAFAEAEWILGPKLVVRAGLRYDYERPADPFPSDSNNWAPRLSFSWAPSPTWLVRGGLGRFYAATPIAPMFVVGVQDGQTVQTRVWPWPDSQGPWGMSPDRRFGAEPDDGVPARLFPRRVSERLHGSGEPRHPGQPAPWLVGGARLRARAGPVDPDRAADERDRPPLPSPSATPGTTPSRRPSRRVSAGRCAFRRPTRMPKRRTTTSISRWVPCRTLSLRRRSAVRRSTSPATGRRRPPSIRPRRRGAGGRATGRSRRSRMSRSAGPTTSWSATTGTATATPPPTVRKASGATAGRCPLSGTST